MSDVSYSNILYSKSWACPSCVPPFKSKTKIIETSDHVNYNTLLYKLAKILNPLRNQCADIFYTTKDFKYKYELCINMFENYGIG